MNQTLMLLIIIMSHQEIEILPIELERDFLKIRG